MLPGLSTRELSSKVSWNYSATKNSWNLYPDPGYEKWKEVLMVGFYPKVKVYLPNGSKDLELTGDKIRDITYTPDFYFDYKGNVIFIDTKGMSTETYRIKKKMFLKNFYMIEDISVIFMEPHNQKQVLQCIEIIKQL